MFLAVHFSSFQMLFDPLINWIFGKCCDLDCCRCFNRIGSVKRIKILEECDERITKELDILSIMRKIRDSYDLVRKL